MPILKKLKSLFTGAPATVVNARYEPESSIEYMDVNRVSSALRSARGGYVQPLFALYRDVILTDSHIQSEFLKRKLAVIGDQLRVLPYDKDDPADVASAEYCEQLIYSIRSWRGACAHLLDGCLLPVSVVEKVYAPEGQLFRLVELVPVPPYLLDLTSGHLQIRVTDDNGRPTSALVDPDPDRYIVHRGHLLSAPDSFGGPMRAILYWWLASAMTRDWWIRLLDRFGMPFVVAKYAPGNDTDRNIILAALSLAKKAFGVAVSTTTEVQIHEASGAGNDAFDRFHKICQAEKSKLILGQTLSAQPDATGLGSGVADLQGEVRDDIRQFDAAMLAECLRDHLLTQACSLASLPGRPPYLAWGSISSAELTARANLLNTLGSAGLEVDDPGIEALSDDVGLGLRRKATPTLPFSSFSASTPRDLADDQVGRQAADLLPALREFPAEAARAIRESSSAAECQERILAIFADSDRRRGAALLAEALAVHAAIGASRAGVR